MTTPRWLNTEETTTWLALWSVTSWLPTRLDEQLKKTVCINLPDYFVLSQVSMATDEHLSMTELAQLSDMSASRLSHTVTRLEQRGWVYRAPDPDDKRTNICHLTDAGRSFIQKAAPGHVETARELVFDALSPEENRELSRLLGKVLDRLDPPRMPEPPPERTTERTPQSSN